ncbi:hypothetical protein [Paludibacter sp. 221]|uniref:hypothetical protein n=1 Tax=Paludibacter sp. 221 TaxID=2302939 RepID=UPI0013D4B23C|nr:hypothetical protein [Paludibacter sp. 221]
MKQYILLVLLICTQAIVAQKAQSVTIEAGKLSESVKNSEQIITLKVSGFMDARDFFFLRDNCPNLANLDIKNVTILKYGDYPAGRIPDFALSRRTNTENWLEMRLNGTIAPTSSFSVTKKLFLLDKKTNLSTAKLSATIPEGASISPDPSKVTISDGAKINFKVTSENGETVTYQYTFYLDNFFTMIVGADSEIDMRNNSVSALQEYTKKIINLHNYSYSYSDYSFIKPKTSLFIMAGDMDSDRGGQLSTFDNVFKQVTDAGIPMITIYGNHDWDPEYWGNDGNDEGYTYTGWQSNERTWNVVNTYIERSKNLGVSDVHVFYSGHDEVYPFVFKFKNVRFYMGQNYWFQPPYYVPNPIAFWESREFYSPDDNIIIPLTNKINSEWKNDAAVWVQHYPLNCADKWWLNENGGGYSLSKHARGKWNTAAKRREKTKEMIRATKNPQFFAGHNHSEAIYTHTHTDGTSFKEYIAGYYPTGRVFMVLLREGIGVVEVKPIQL